MSAALFRWVAEGPLQLVELLFSHGLLRALGDGRVFVDTRRVQEPRELSVGAVVEVFAQRPPADIEILHEADDVFAVYKPASLPTEPDKSGNDCVVHQFAAKLRLSSQEVFAVSRLDVGVSGVLLLAVGAAGRQRLLEERASGTLRRRYVALACGVPSPHEGEWREALGRGGRGNRVVAGRDAQHAHTKYRVVATAQPAARDAADTSLLALSPVTGRTHQLRVHASSNGVPLLGDRRYGGPARMTASDGAVRALSRVLLHAAWVEWGPKKRLQRVVSEACADLLDTWLALGGDPSALQRALDA
jgi:23S rRNA-/tRNA-specific pseudouridylate synthase